MAGVGLAFLLEYLDNTIKNEQDIERVLGLPVSWCRLPQIDSSTSNGIKNAK